MKVGVVVLLAACSAKPAASSIVIRHVTIVDVATGELHRDQEAVIDGDRIQSVGPSSDGPGEIIDGRGK